MVSRTLGSPRALGAARRGRAGSRAPPLFVRSARPARALPRSRAASPARTPDAAAPRDTSDAAPRGAVDTVACGTLHVRTVEEAEFAVRELYARRAGVAALDTEVDGLDIQHDSPACAGDMVCFSVHASSLLPEALAGEGGTPGSPPAFEDADTGVRVADDALSVWVDTDGEHGVAVLEVFRGYLEDASVRKVWHNYGFDRHVFERAGVRVAGFYGDTMHMARLYDASRASVAFHAEGEDAAGETARGYSLASLSRDPSIVGKKFASETPKVSMKELFAKNNVKQDGTLAKTMYMPGMREIQWDPDAREKWVHYALLDARATWHLHFCLTRLLMSKPIEFPDGEDLSGREAAAISGCTTLYDLYVSLWRPFGEILTDMEATGFRIDTDYLREQQAAADRDLTENELVFRRWVDKVIPGAFFMNSGSTLQLQTLFFGGWTNPEKAAKLMPELDELAPAVHPAARELAIDEQELELAKKRQEAAKEGLTGAKKEARMAKQRADREARNARQQARKGAVSAASPEAQGAVPDVEALVLEVEACEDRLARAKEMVKSCRASVALTKAAYKKAAGAYDKKEREVRRKTQIEPTTWGTTESLHDPKVVQKYDFDAPPLQHHDADSASIVGNSAANDATASDAKGFAPALSPEVNAEVEEYLAKYLRENKAIVEAHAAEIAEPKSSKSLLEMSVEERERERTKDRVKLLAKAVQTAESDGIPNKVELRRVTEPTLQPVAFTKTGMPQMSTPVLKMLAGSEDKPGPLVDAFKTRKEGEEACTAVRALVQVSAINTLLESFIMPLQGLYGILDANDRVHGSLNMNTETGRLSSRRPNLQNQPALEKDRYNIRRAFVASPGNTLIVADYGQLELRILAHIADCTAMKEAFATGGDFHSRTAVNMYSFIQDDIANGTCLLEKEAGSDPNTPLVKDKYGAERRKAKTLNFSIAYGKTAHGLAKDWDVSMKEAEDTVKAWYDSRPEVRDWQERMRQEARRYGAVCTLLGRRRPLPDITSKNSGARGRAERAAINTPIQGSAADIVTLAMVEVASDARLRELGYTMLLQVHDEIIIEGPIESADEAQRRLVHLMGHPFRDESSGELVNKLTVELAVDSDKALSWYEAK